MTQIRHSILMILWIVAIALAAVLVLLAPHDRALAQPGSEPPGFDGMLVLASEFYLGRGELSFSDLDDQPPQ